MRQKQIGELPNLESEYFVTEFIPYLLNSITNKMNQRFKSSLKKFKLNVSQWRVLVALGIKGDVSLTALGDFTAIDQPSLSRIVDQLVERNLVTRVPRANDGRFSEISLSKEGRALRDVVWPLAVKHSEMTVAALTRKEQDNLNALLKKMMTSFS